MNRFIFYIAFLFLSSVVLGQNISVQDGDIKDAQIVVEKDRKIELPTINRGFDKIQYVPEIKNTTKQTFDSKPIESKKSDLENVQFRALKVEKDKLDKLYGNFIKIGYGNYNTPYLNGYVASKRNNEHVYGIQFNHLSSSKGPTPFSAQSNTNVSAFGGIYLKHLFVKGVINYNRLSYRYYGFDHDKIKNVNEDSIKQTINIFNPTIQLKYSKDKLSINGNLFLNYLNTKNTNELEFGYNYLGEYKLSDESSLLINTDLSLVNLNYKDSSLTRSYFMFTPYYKIKNEKLILKIGANFTSHNDTINDSDKLHIYPDIEANYTIMDKSLIGFLGFNGKIQRNTLSSILEENPYLDDNTFVFDNNNSTSLFAGIKGGLNSYFSFLAKASIENYKNLHFYVNAPYDTTKFNMISNIGIVTNTKYYLSIDYNKNELLKGGLSIELNNFKFARNYEEAFHRPKMIFAGYVAKDFSNKIYVSTTIRYISGITAYSFTKQKSILLNDVFDINLDLNYKLSDKFSTFVLINNVLSKDYQVYLNYPVKKINIVAGLTYSF